MRISPQPRRIVLVLAFAIAGVWGGVLAFDARAEDSRAMPTSAPQVAPTWPEDVVERVARIPVLDEGRVKPLNTYATYALYRLNYRRSLKIPVAGQSGPDAEMRKIGPVEWLLDVMFYPEVARTYECFMVETDEVLTALGLSTEGMKKKKRDRYAYDFLSRGRQRLGQLYGEYHRIDPKNREPVQGAIVALAQHMIEFEILMDSMNWARRSPFPVPDNEALRAYFGGADQATFTDLVRTAPRIAERMDQLRREGGDEQGAQTVMAWRRMVESATRGANEHAPRLFPPTREQMRSIKQLVDSRAVDPDAIHAEEWLSAPLLLRQAVQFPVVPVSDVHLEMIADLEAMVDQRTDMASFAEHARSFDDKGEELARSIGEAEKIGMEVFLFRAGLLSLPKHFFLLAFVLIAVTWAFKGRKPWYDWLVIAPALLLPTLMLITGIVIRSVLRERPPMSTLYDTVLFITAFMVVSAIVVELLHKKRIALALAPVVGFLGMGIAVGYEDLTRQDTMPRLVAVLDTNFWLATHVTCIAIGYAASLLTAVVGNVYVLAKVIGIKKNAPDRQEFYTTLGRMLYGMLAFGLIFATVGTILGGIWANDSWGRFWGWDPKENGALMIVLWQLAMVHARLGGLIKTWGLAMASAVLGAIVAFSWWGVNLLGIGLHSYGFTQGVSDSLNLYYLSQGLILFAGTVWWLAQRPSAASQGA